jgi:hypothetical protein
VYAEDDFLHSLDNLKNNKISPDNEDSRSLYFFKESLRNKYPEITQELHKNHRGKDLEIFMAQVFKSISCVLEVKLNGFGWRSDHGADLIVSYKVGLPIPGLEEERKLVVQIKSYEGEHWETFSVDQIVNAMEHYSADAGLIISTAQSTEFIENVILEKSSNVGKPIALMAGGDVAKFVLQHRSDLF